jgi:hypothetical protein
MKPAMDEADLENAIKPMAQAFFARLATRGFLYAAGILGGVGVTVTSQDGFQHASAAVGLDAASLLFFGIHWLIANRMNLHFFNLGRSVQSGVTPVTAMPPAPVEIPAPATLVNQAAARPIDTTKPTSTAPRLS